MDDKPPPSSRRSSGHNDKVKKPCKKKRKNKYKDRKHGSKLSSPDETNSDSAVETGRKQSTPESQNVKKFNSSKCLSTSQSASSASVGIRKSTSSSSDDFLRKCVSDIFERHQQPSVLQSSQNSQTSVGRKSAELDLDTQDVSEQFNESLRWDNPCSDPEDEEARIQIYKINRRKRYLMESVKRRQDKEGVLKFARELAATDLR